MKIFIKDGKINFNKEGIECEVAENFFDNYILNVEEYFFLNIDGKVLASEDSEKIKKISQYKEIEKEAIQKRSEYITAELLPESIFKTMKLAKLENDRIDIEARYNECINSLVYEYSEEILHELL